MSYSLGTLSAWTQEDATKFLTAASMRAKTLRYLTPWAGLKGPVKLPLLESAYDNWQAGTGCAASPSGTLTISQKTLTPKAITIFDRFCQNDLEPYFTRQLLPAGSYYDGLSPIEGAIVSLMGDRFGKMMELVTWKGVEGGSDAIASLNLLDGFDQVIADNLASIPAAQKLSGSVAEADIINTVEAVVTAMPIDQFEDANDNGGYVMYMGSDVRRTYLKKYRSSLTALPYNTSFDKIEIDGTTIELVGVPGLTGTDQIVLIRKEDMWYGFDMAGEVNAPSFTVQQGTGSERFYTFVSHRFHLGFQINYVEKAVVNGY